MDKIMMNRTSTLLDEGKKSLNALLREKAYDEVVEKFRQEGIAVKNVNDEDIEALVAAKVNDMMNGIKSFAAGTAFALLFTAVVGF
jgi:fructose-1,6-bisphosphatase/sedoheptulose 1,7-bisphosphatase-like protein